MNETNETYKTKFIAALREIEQILCVHPTNQGVGEGVNWRPLNPGEEGYDSCARYAYLVACEALKGIGTTDP